MNWLDFVLVVILVVMVISGLRRGFAQAAMGFVALIASVFCGLWFYGIPAAWVREFFASQQVANFVGFGLIFGAVSVAGLLIGWGLSKLLKAAHLSTLDRLAGGAFGALQGVLFGAVVVTAFMAFAPKAPPSSVAHSRVAPYVMHAARAVVAAAPHEVKTGFRNSYDRVKELWSESVRKGVPRGESHI